MKQRHQQKLLISAGILFCLWNIPFVLAFGGDSAVLGIPSMYFSIFLIWAASIAFSFAVIKKYDE